MKRRLRIAGWALGLSLAMAGIGAAVGASQGAPVESKAVGGQYYTLVTSDSELSAGSLYLIATATTGSAKVAGNATNNDYRVVVDTTISADNKITFDNSTMLALELGGSKDEWTLDTVNYPSEGHLTASSSASGNNKLYVNSGSYSDYAKFRIGIDSSNYQATIHANGTNNRYIKFNSDRISSYVSGQSPVYLFKEIPPETGVAKSVQITTAETPYVGEQIVLTGTVSYEGTKEPDHRVTWSVKDPQKGSSTVTAAGVVTVGQTETVIVATAMDKGQGGVDIFAEYTVTPVANPITNVTFNTAGANRKDFYVGDAELDISGITATATRLSGNTEPYSLKASNFTGFDSSVPTESQTITISVEVDDHEYSDTYQIRILEKRALKFGTKYSKVSASPAVVEDKYGVQWNIASTFASDASYSTNNDFQQFGSGTKSVSTVTIDADLGEAKTIKYAYAKFAAYNLKEGKETGSISLKIDGTQKATGTLDGDTIVTVALPQVVKGQEISFELTGLARLKIYEIDYVAMTDAECVADFIDNYMHMDDYTENLGYCKDVSHHYYADAKAAFNALLPEQRALFASEVTYADARARLQNWAAANGDVFDVNNTLVKAYQGTFGGLSNNDPTAFAVAGLIGGMLLATGIGVLVIRRKKQK